MATKKEIDSVTDLKFKHIEAGIAEIKGQQDQVQGMLETLRKEIKSDISTSRAESIEEFKKYVTNERFAPVQLIVFGMVGAILLIVLGAILSLVVMNK